MWRPHAGPVDEGMRDCRGSREGSGGPQGVSVETPQHRRRGEGSLGSVSGGSAWLPCGHLPTGQGWMSAWHQSASSGHWAEMGFLALSQLTPVLSPDVGGPADPIAPTIIIPPKNTSVVAGTSEVTMECVANARWAAPLPTPLTPLHSPPRACSEETRQNSEGPWGVI